MALMAISRRRLRPLAGAVAVFVLIYFFIELPLWRSSGVTHDLAYYRHTYPLLWKHVYSSTPDRGGAWYIPPTWLDPSDPEPTNILEAARLAYGRADALSHTIPYSAIPLIIHQTWKDTRIESWTPDTLSGTEQWLKYAMETGNSSMAYFLWLDDGCDQLIQFAEPHLVESLKALPLPVMRSDIFRIVVTNTIGGIYGDIDTVPLRSPATWVDEADIMPWTDEETGAKYDLADDLDGSSSSDNAVRLLLGIEADTPPDTDTHWRMGYNYNIQLTQWALAAAPSHPILHRLLTTFSDRIREIAAEYDGDVSAAAAAGALKTEDPLKLTGPEAITVAAKEILKAKAGLRWQALTGLKDGGRSKLVDSTIILPITGFSPGRAKNYGNMGSKPITDPAARLQHKAQGSWRKVDVKVELGKACRTFLGLCKEWSKVPG